MNIDHISKNIPYKKIVSLLKSVGLYPSTIISEGAATGPSIISQGKSYLSFGSNNYLGLSNDNRVKEAVKIGIDKYGIGSGGPRVLGGNIDIQNTLEFELASFLNRADAICYTTGYMANIGVIPAIANFFKVPGLENEVLELSNSTLLLDEFCHGSIRDGAVLSKKPINFYKHNNIMDLSLKVQDITNGRCIILTQGVFGVEGEITPLKQLADVAPDSFLMIDDADGIGILGEEGRGSAEHSGLENRIDVVMGSFTKAFGCFGGFIAGNKELMDYFRISSKTYLISTPLPPAICMGIIKSIEIMRKEPERRQRAMKLTQYFREEMKKLKFEVIGDHPLIVPILIGGEFEALKISEKLKERGISVPVMRYPVVSRGKAKLRFSFTALHEMIHVEKVLNVILEVMKNHE